MKMTVNDLFEMLRAGGLVPRGDAAIAAKGAAT